MGHGDTASSVGGLSLCRRESICNAIEVQKRAETTRAATLKHDATRFSESKAVLQHVKRAVEVVQPLRIESKVASVRGVRALIRNGREGVTMEKS